MLANDVSKSLLKTINSASDTVDYFLVDFIDERFHLILCEETIATYSVAMQQAIPDAADDNRLQFVKSGSDLHFELFANGFSLFSQIAETMAKPVIVNRVYWGKSDGDSNFYKSQEIDDANNYLHRLYEYVGKQRCDLLPTRVNQNVLTLKGIY